MSSTITVLYSLILKWYLITWFRTNLYFFVILSSFYSLICVCTYRSFLILLFQLSNKWHLFIHQYIARFNYITMLISVAVYHCVASPLGICTLEAGVKTNVKSGKFKFFLFSLYSTFCWQVKFCDVDS